jgi:hypothetical protein
MSVPPDEQKILGKTPTEWSARQHALARQAIDDLDPRDVVADAETFERAARRMFDLTWANGPHASEISWETDAAPKDSYFGSVRFAAEEALGMQRPEDFRGFVSGWRARASSGGS